MYLYVYVCVLAMRAIIDSATTNMVVLLQSLLDATPQLHSDFCPTHKLYKSMDAFIRKIEDAKRKEESHGRVIELQSLIKIPLVRYSELTFLY